MKLNLAEWMQVDFRVIAWSNDECMKSRRCCYYSVEFLSAYLVVRERTKTSIGNPLMNMSVTTDRQECVIDCQRRKRVSLRREKCNNDMSAQYGIITIDLFVRGHVWYWSFSYLSCKCDMNRSMCRSMICICLQLTSNESVSCWMNIKFLCQDRQLR
jgi:hypothetical protein